LRCSRAWSAWAPPVRRPRAERVLLLAGQGRAGRAVPRAQRALLRAVL